MQTADCRLGIKLTKIRDGPWTRSTGLVHGLGSQGWSMDWVHRGGPWTGPTGVVHGLGPQGWSIDWVHRGGPWTRVHVLYMSKF